MKTPLVIETKRKLPGGRVIQLRHILRDKSWAVNFTAQNTRNEMEVIVHESFFLTRETMTGLLECVHETIEQLRKLSAKTTPKQKRRK